MTSNSAHSSDAKRARKRQQSPVFNGVGTTCEEKKSDFLCPICFETINEAHMTKCGHSFCNACILESLKHNNRCPKCNQIIEKDDPIYPNFVLNDLIEKHNKIAEKKMKLGNMKSLKIVDLLSEEGNNLSLSDISHMLQVLVHKKEKLEADCRLHQILLLKEFITKAQARKQEELKRATEELKILEDDAASVEDILQKHLNSSPGANLISCEPSTSKSCIANNTSNYQVGFNGVDFIGKKLQGQPSAQANRRKRMYVHFDDLEQTYFNMRISSSFGLNAGDPKHKLEEFGESLSKFTKFTSANALATLNYSNEIINSSNIVSSIEFDKDNQFFAIAGVTKKIKLFEYASVICNPVEAHYPICEMLCNSKISCISWSSYHKGLLASSDYEGTVNLWEGFSGRKVRSFQEHEKRCWSVDFNHINTKLIASGSDDSKVKLWAINAANSISCIDAKANVCCVKFNPKSATHLAFGSADHCVHYYDLRNTKHALEIFKGHQKAVSYVKFLNTETIVSASTDSQLKLWDVSQPCCIRSFKGHLNEKNFVGLATNGEFIACGSENNSLYVYYKGLSSDMLTFPFDATRGILDTNKKEDDSTEFVSAVCWKDDSSVVVAANSQGIIKVLELY